MKGTFLTMAHITEVKEKKLIYLTIQMFLHYKCSYMVKKQQKKLQSKKTNDNCEKYMNLSKTNE